MRQKAIDSIAPDDLFALLLRCRTVIINRDVIKPLVRAVVGAGFCDSPLAPDHVPSMSALHRPCH